MITTEQIGPITKFQLARTMFGRGVYFTAAYWVDGLVVDTGCLHTVPELLHALDGMRIVRVVNTHSHEDHIAGNAALAAKYNVEILAHPLALPFLANPRLRKLHPYQVVLWGHPPPSMAQPTGTTVETDRYRFQVIHAPGHSPDQICLFEPDQGWLFTGDAYVGGSDQALRRDYHIWQIIASLKKLAALEPAVIYSGSGSVRDKAREELARKIKYLEETGQKILELHRKGWSPWRIRSKLFGRETFIAYMTLGHFSGKNLVRSYIEDR